MKNKKTLGNIMLILAAMIWGTAFAWQRVGMESIEPITFIAARMALSAVLVGLIAVIFDKKEKRSSTRTASEQKEINRQSVIGGICCGLFLTFASMFQQFGVVYTTAGKAGFITAMYMLIVPVISFVLFKKKNSLRVWLAVLIGIAGMYLLCVTESFSLTRGDALVLVCAFLFSGHILCCDYFVGKGNPIKISAIQFVTATVISTVFAFIFETPTVDKIISAAVPVLYCGIMSGGVGYTLQIIAQGFTDPTIASLLMSLESVFAVIGGVIILGEKMTLQETLGCVVMFAAIILVQLPTKKASS